MTENEHGPFASVEEVMGTRAAAALRAACDASPAAWEAQHLKVMTDACGAAGVTLGAFDLAPLRQLAMYEPFHAVVLAGIIRRAHEAGKAVALEGAETEWGVAFTHVRTPDGNHVVGPNRVEGWADEEAARKRAATTLFADDPDMTVTVVRRDVGPWKEAPRG